MESSIEAKNIEAKGVEAEGVEAKDVEAKDVEAKDVEAKDVEAKGVEANSQDASTLEAALRQHRVGLPPEIVAKLDDYCRALWEWNEKLNLTRHTTYDKFVSRDVVDTIQISNLIEVGKSVLDVGSGGGIPGLALGILRPDLRIVLSEPVGKKARVLEDLVTRLNLGSGIQPSTSGAPGSKSSGRSNSGQVSVEAIRGEVVVSKQSFDYVIARAVGPLSQFLRWFQPHWKRIGAMLIIKGPRWVEERGEARHRGLLKSLELRVAATYPFPGTDSNSVILRIWPKADKQPETGREKPSPRPA